MVFVKKIQYCNRHFDRFFSILDASCADAYSIFMPFQDYIQQDAALSKAARIAVRDALKI